MSSLNPPDPERCPVCSDELDVNVSGVDASERGDFRVVYVECQCRCTELHVCPDERSVAYARQDVEAQHLEYVYGLAASYGHEGNLGAAE